MAIKEKLDSLEPEQRERAVKVGILIIGGFLLLGLYYVTGQDDAVVVEEERELSLIELGDERLEDDVRAQVEREREEQRNANQKQDSLLELQQEQLASQAAQLDLMKQALEAFQNSALELPMPADMPNSPPPEFPREWQEGGPAMPVEPIVEFVGGIGAIVNTALDVPDSNSGGERSGRPKFYLPTSFMPAMLLTGLKAKTVESAREDPEPMLLRVQAPAILPNDVRASLQGCLVVAHGFGSLASERVEARLVSLSCLDYEGRSIIDQEITGIVVDKDGVKGLAGRPVSKMGANLARLLLAGMVEGAGEAISESAATTSVSALGQTQSIQPSQVTRAGIGGGISHASKEITRVYLDLVRQSAPVIEIGPTKEVTVVLTEGVWLEVQDYEQ